MGFTETQPVYLHVEKQIPPLSILKSSTMKSTSELFYFVLVFQVGGRSDLFLEHHVTLVSCLIHSVLFFPGKRCIQLSKSSKMLLMLIPKYSENLVLLSCSSYQNLYLRALNSVIFLVLSPCLAPWLQFSQVYLLYLPLMVRPITFNSSSGLYLPWRTFCLELWNDHTFVKECCSMLFLFGININFYIHLYFTDMVTTLLNLFTWQLFCDSVSPFEIEIYQYAKI